MGGIRWIKGWLTSWMEPNETAGEFITILRMACYLKLANCLFLEFSNVIFSDRGWPQVMKPQKVKPWISVDCCTLSLSFFPSNTSSLFNSCPFFKICALYISLMNHFLNALNQGFSTSAELPIWGYIIRCGKGLSWPCRMFYSILGLSPWDISSFSTPKWWRWKLFPDFAKCFLEDKVVPGGNHCSKQQ